MRDTEGEPASLAPDEAEVETEEVTGGVYHTVVLGEYLSLIALNYGVSSWEAIYYHAANMSFRALRPDPNIIEPGDVVFVPQAAVC